MAASWPGLDAAKFSASGARPQASSGFARASDPPPALPTAAELAEGEAPGRAAVASPADDLSGLSPGARALEREVRVVLSRMLHKPPVQIQVAVDAMRLCRDPNVQFDHIERLLMRDGPLTAKVIALANSPLYRPVTPIRSVRAAAVRVGLREVRELLAQAIAMCHIFDVPRFAAESALMRGHAIESAHVARLCAEHARPAEVDDAFMMGLLHDAGRAVVLSALSTRRDVLERAMPADIELLSDARHAAVGEQALEAWGLGPKFSAVARWHGASGDRPPPTPIVDLIAAAERVIWACDGGMPSAPALEAFAAQSVVRRAGLDADRLARVSEAFVAMRPALWKLAGVDARVMANAKGTC